MNNQSRLGSFVEAWANVFIGFGISMVANLAVLPFFGFNVTVFQSFNIGLIMTVISITRSYLLRRLFNSLRLFNHDIKAKG